jgi:hypothetical protein
MKKITKMQRSADDSFMVTRCLQEMAGVVFSQVVLIDRHPFSTSIVFATVETSHIMSQLMRLDESRGPGTSWMTSHTHFTFDDYQSEFHAVELP